MSERCLLSVHYGRFQVHRLSPAKVTFHKHPATGVLAPSLILAACIVIWAIEKSNWSTIAEAVVYLTLPLRLYGATPSVSPASPDVFVGVLDVNWNGEHDRDLSEIPTCGMINGRFSFQVYFLPIREKFYEILMNCPSNAASVV